ncbi:MAG: ABC transporter permease [Tepidiformaceae bacterium]
MLRYALRRFLWMIPTIFAVSAITFFALNAIPGDLARLYLDPDATEDQVDAFNHSRGLDKPIVERYFIWLGDIARGDPGSSLAGGASIGEQLQTRLPVTLHVVVFGVFFATLFGVVSGVVAAVKHSTPIDYGIRVFVVFAQSFPDFFLLTLLLLLPAIFWQYSPPIGYAGPIWEHPWRDLKQFVPPTALLGLGSAFLTRITRSSVLEVMHSDYIRTARMKGLSARVVFYRHTFRNALIPIITLVGAAFAALLGGSVILEQVMTIPGLGQYTYQAVLMRDINVVQAMTLYAALSVMFVNLLVDLSYAVIDPRIQYR